MFQMQTVWALCLEEQEFLTSNSICSQHHSRVSMILHWQAVDCAPSGNDYADDFGYGMLPEVGYTSCLVLFVVMSCACASRGLDEGLTVQLNHAEI